MIFFFAIYFLTNLLISSDYSQDDKNSEILFNLLEDNKDWVIINKEEDISLFTKQVPGHDIYAIKISQIISIPLEIIQNIIMDVDNYESVLSNADGLISNSESITDSLVIAYQFIPIDLPFFDDRHYYFELKKSDLSFNKKQTLVKWNLIDKNLFNKDRNSLNTIYLKYGAGIWMAEKDEFDNILLSYRIFMDPSGSIPDFIIDKINEISIVNLFTDVLIEAEKRVNKK